MLSGSGVLRISFYKRLTRNTEIGNTPSEFCPIPEDWASKEFGTNVSNKIFLNAAKSQGYSFTVSELLRENQREGGHQPPTQIRVNKSINKTN